MHISYLPDEMKIDFEEALKVGADMGVGCIELRAVNGVNVIDLDDDALADVQRLLKKYRMDVSAIATPFFKCAVPGRESQAYGNMHSAREMSYDDHLSLLRRGADIAARFETPRIRMFTFWRVEGVDFWPHLERTVAVTLDRLDGSGAILCLENEGACFIRSGADMAEVVRRIPDERLKLIWDPGNAARVGSPPRAEDWEVFRDRVALVHIKDGSYDAGKGASVATLIGEGEAGYPEELRRVAQVYDGPLTLEPHYAPGGDTVEGMRQSVAALRGQAEKAGVSLAS